MANYSRDDMENQGKAEADLLGALLCLGAFAVTGVVMSINKNLKIADLSDKLRSVQIQLSNYKSGFWGSIFNKNKISDLVSQEQNLENMINELKR